MAINRLPCQTLLAFALAFAFACATRLTATAEETRPDGGDGLLDKLAGMRIKEPGAVRSVLHSLGLELGEDFEILSDGEREEMLSGLAEQGISLGDRSKVRHDFDDLQAGEGHASETKEEDRERNTHPKGIHVPVYHLAPPRGGCRTLHVRKAGERGGSPRTPSR
jgi:hypothetical protein